MPKRWLLAALLPCWTVAVAQDNDSVGVVAVDTSVIQTNTLQEVPNFSYRTEAEPVAVQNLPPEKVRALQQNEDYWYANLEPEKKKPVQEQAEDTDPGLLGQRWFQQLLWILILTCFIGVVIWYLASSNIRLFRKAAKKVTTDEETDEPLPDDLFSINYTREIAKAETAGDYRLAVRLRYLNTLRQLADRQLIDYRVGKTNSDYVTALFGTRHYRDFFRLTRHFEYTWYGQFPLPAEAYQLLQTDFVNFQNSLGA